VYEIKYSRGILETILTTTAEMVENFGKLQLGRIVKTPFNLKRHKIDLLEAEVNAPGREIAYTIRARKVFEKKP